MIYILGHRNLTAERKGNIYKLNMYKFIMNRISEFSIIFLIRKNIFYICNYLSIELDMQVDMQVWEIPGAI